MIPEGSPPRIVDCVVSPLVVRPDALFECKLEPWWHHRTRTHLCVAGGGRAEELQSPEMGKLERERDALQLAVLGALNVMMIDKACRDRVLPVDPGVQTILKLCRRLKG